MRLNPVWVYESPLYESAHIPPGLREGGRAYKEKKYFNPMGTGYTLPEVGAAEALETANAARATAEKALLGDGYILTTAGRTVVRETAQVADSEHYKHLHTYPASAPAPAPYIRRYCLSSQYIQPSRYRQKAIFP